MNVRAVLLAVIPAAVITLPGTVAAQDLVRTGDTTTPDRTAQIRNALSAAPAGIAGEAAVADWDGNTLRGGSNGYTCLPDDPNLPGNSPMCLDADWMAWAQAWMAKTPPPSPKAVSIAYMLQGDFPTSNTDPFATAAAEDNEWIVDAGPHIMLLVPDAAALGGMSTDATNGGPWVMWRDTPYAHLMIPTARKQ